MGGRTGAEPGRAGAANAPGKTRGKKESVNETGEKKAVQRAASFNGMTAREWAAASKNVWNDVSSPRSGTQLDHGATFPEKLAARIIAIYSREGDLVLDPFVGTGTTLSACSDAGRNGIGIELNERYHAAAEGVTKRERRTAAVRLAAIKDDCRNVLHHVEPESVQLVITSPPYANFIQKAEADRKKTHKNSIITKENNSRVKRYSDQPEDFGNLQYGEFLDAIKGLMEKLLVVTKPGGYNVWIVKDARDTRRGVPYVSFHSDFARLGEAAGFAFHDLIVWDQNEQRRLVLLGYPSVFYTNQNCSFMVVLRKPVT
ncbi:MAG: site-specific DNA-methyltransferase [Candidatus Lokiarchaeota archaeon]|nr:site-specific DNA-methyltransferase [Candidatus Lokiarchaeota archaeon]